MSSVPQLPPIFVQWTNYGTLAILTAVGYDYVLVFPKEIRYIWSKPWTWVSTLFILVRYCGLLNLVCVALDGTTFVPGPAETLFNSCEVIYITMQWSFFVFFGAADMIMILRVWVIYNKSRLILRTLLVLFFIEVVSNVVCDAFNSIPKVRLWITSQEYPYCRFAAPPPLKAIILEQVAYASLIIFAVTLCGLATVQFVRQSLQMYRVTKQWRLNPYISLLVKQGIVYFFAFLLLNVVALLYSWGETPSNNGLHFLLTFVMYVPVYTLPPRFVISIRELYEHDVQGRCERGIDTGFGLSTLSDRGTTGLGLRIAFRCHVENKTREDIESDAGQSEGTGGI